MQSPDWLNLSITDVHIVAAKQEPGDANKEESSLFCPL